MENDQPPKSIDGVRRSRPQPQPNRPQRRPPSAPELPQTPRRQQADSRRPQSPQPAANGNLADIDLGEIDPTPLRSDEESVQWWQFVRRLRRFTKRYPKHFTKKRLAIYSSASVLMVAASVAAWLLLISNQIIVRNTGDGALALQDDVDPTKLRGEGDGRVNVLLIGIGGDEHKAGNLADSIIVVSLDPFSKDVAMLSIPRDLWVEIPGFGSSKINAAHAFGEQYDHPGGGPALLKETLAGILDIPIHYYIRVDFTGFKQAVDTVGGITVNVEETINDFAYPDQQLRGYEPFYIEAGQQYLDGDTALRYARSRYTTSDFDRANRQRQILIALKDKATSLGTLTNPLKISSLIDAAGRHVRTDLQMNEIMKLVEIGQGVNRDQILSVGLDNSPDNFLASASRGGASALVPKAGDFSAIQRYVRGLLVDGFIKQENASVEVLNGTSAANLARDTAELLRSFGYNIVKVGDHQSKDVTQTIIYDTSGGAKPYTVRYLEQRFGVSAQQPPEPAGSQADITIIVGSDYTLQE